MDPVSLTLAILPLVGTAISVYKSVRSKFKIFCHYSAEVERIWKLFRGQHGYFLNEVELVLRLVLRDQAIVEAMMKDPTHVQWRADGLEKELGALFGRNLLLLEDVLHDINESIAALYEAFQCFLPLEEGKDEKSETNLALKDEHLKMKPLKDAVRQLRKRVKITFEKKDFEHQITGLEKSNSRLGRLREQVTALQTPSHCAARRPPKKAKQLAWEFVDYGAIQRASSGLYEALSKAWSSAQAPSLRHFVMLFLDAKAENGVQMEIAILCAGGQLQQRALHQASLTRVKVLSRTIDSITWPNAGLPASASEMNISQADQRKRLKVRFPSQGSDVGSGAESGSCASTASTLSTVDPSDELQFAGHFCLELSRRFSRPDRIDSTEGLGHIDSCVQETFRHFFFPCSNASLCNNMGLEDVTLMDEALVQPVYNKLTVVCQLRLAHRLVSAVLKFNSTPWLNELWSVGDLSFFRQGDDLTLSLQTLHFGVELIHGTAESTNSSREVECPAGLASLIENAQYRHGVRNMTLYSLGAALLAIGRWERIDHNNVEGVRRLASQPCCLGPVYQELTQKVLDCDFGHGNDLKKPRLREAIYDVVILELESMIASLDMSDK
ncbi:hypothetical protein Trco_007029 [Trichoderma cornu-damae]|uniref:Uncharacterized protein n=1 Tax=Trichoderma cornu-damae TaxID=654480 RepID=A0A9P8QMZ4_9HYPO|nr:hypothetical protein Trco_007029 [Trichoderma cornu-damae]